MRNTIEVFVVESHPIYRCGLAQCLRELPNVQLVSEAASAADARASAGFAEANLVLVDNELPDAPGLVREIAERNDTHAIVMVPRADVDVVEAAHAGAIGFLSKDTLTPEALAGAVQAASNGTSVIAPGLLAVLVEPHRNGRPRPSHYEARAGALTPREQRVLSLLADGHPTREVAERLSYSERTVKNVLHDAITKLGARSRSQAVAYAVRDGLI
jgi:two-component system nitrate/nitrite response regulator NarL